MLPPADVIPFADFFTATCLEWKGLLKPDKYKDIIVDSLCFWVNNSRVKVYAFVVMQNHLHLIWQVQQGHRRTDVQRDFFKFMAQRIKEDLKRQYPQMLEQLWVNAKDRTISCRTAIHFPYCCVRMQLLCRSSTTCTKIRFVPGFVNM